MSYEPLAGDLNIQSRKVFAVVVNLDFLQYCKLNYLCQLFALISYCLEINFTVNA